MKINQFPDRKITINHKEYLYFGGTSYLGLATNTAFQEIVCNNIKQWGTSYGSSQSANIKLAVYEEGEKYLAKHIKSEAAITVSSGMLAGKLVIDELQRQTDSFYYFPNHHTAISTPNSQPFFVDATINPKLIDDKPENVTIVTDAVPSGQVEPINLNALLLIPNHKNITLVIDESHSLGILGKNGCGIFSSFKLPSVKRTIVVSSLGKAFGLSGGVIASDVEFVNTIRNTVVFVSSAGMNPAFLHTIIDAKEIYIQQHRKLLENLRFLGETLLKSSKIVYNNNYPVYYPKISGISDILFENNIIITNFNYPTETKELNRIVITANHTYTDLQVLAAVLNKYL